MVPINLIALVAVTFHAVTFLSLAPKATVVRLDGWRVPGYMIAGGNYGLWAFASLVIAWVVL
jgi:fumarate reductase subunit C